MMSLIARAPSHVSSSTSVSPVKRSYGNQNPRSTIAEKEERSWRPDIGIDRMKASDYYYHEQFMESFSSASYSKCDDDRAWSSQEWKTDTEMYERSGRPDETSWRATREIRPGFSHEETLHDGTMDLQKPRGNLMQKRYLLGLMTWKVTERNVWKDVANLQIKPLSNFTKSQRNAWMTINLKKKKMSQWEDCLQFAHKLL